MRGLATGLTALAFGGGITACVMTDNVEHVPIIAFFGFLTCVIVGAFDLLGASAPPRRSAGRHG
ncbi:MAG TPA: hypothetical protein VEB18_02400 [Candidatus Paceibacterota bacterium]|nr:hypothetical protein [Candidatus Paceibacterota bacterium]